MPTTLTTIYKISDDNSNVIEIYKEFNKIIIQQHSAKDLTNNFIALKEEEVRFLKEVLEII